MILENLFEFQTKVFVGLITTSAEIRRRNQEGQWMIFGQRGTPNATPTVGEHKAKKVSISLPNFWSWGACLRMLAKGFLRSLRNFSRKQGIIAKCVQ